MKRVDGTGKEHHDRHPIKPNIVVEGGLLLTMKDDDEPVDGATLLIQDDRIVGCVSSLRARCDHFRLGPLPVVDQPPRIGQLRRVIVAETIVSRR